MRVEANAGRASIARPATNAYLVCWVAVAAFGLGYIGVAATKPELLGSILPIAETNTEPSAVSRQVADNTEEVAVLRKQVHELQHEVAAAKVALQEQATQAGALAQRMAAAEERLPPVREVSSEPPAPPAKGALQRVQARPPTRPAAAQVAAPPVQEAAAAATPNVKVLNPQPAAQIATGSLPDAGPQGAAAKAVPSFGPARVKAAGPPASPRGIEIASSDSLEGLRAKWGELSGRAGDVLASAAPRYRLSTDGRAAPFTLLAGPYETPADAAKACQALQAKGVACRVGAYAGNSF